MKKATVLLALLLAGCDTGNIECRRAEEKEDLIKECREEPSCHVTPDLLADRDYWQRRCHRYD